MYIFDYRSTLHFEYYPWALKFWVPNPNGYPRVIPKILNFMGTQPENTHGIQTQTQPNPYPKFGSGPGITLGYPNFGYPILAIVLKYTVIKQIEK